MEKNALAVLKERYLWKLKSGRLETPEELFQRVAKTLAPKDLKLRKSFYSVMVSGEFLPNSPTLMNAGRKNGQLAACFVLPLEDDLAQIMDTLKLTALVHQSGGGTGFSFSRLRAAGSPVHSSEGAAAGPLGFLKIFNELTENIKQGGLRRGANMGILSVDHPDIRKFVKCKKDTSQFTNFNISVNCTDKFMKAVQNGGTHKDSKLFTEIAEAAWLTGEPGLVFSDAVNRANPTPYLGAMEATNPCGEQPLLPYEACNLGSINLDKVVTLKSGGAAVDWEKLSSLVELGVLFLNSVVDHCYYPDPRIHDLCHANRKIGLGVMGFADMLIKLKVGYGSVDSLKLAKQVMGFIREQAVLVSQTLAKKRGAFDGFNKSLWKKCGYKPMRNATLTTVAPTGTISIIAGCTPGIEPVFNFVFNRHVLDGHVFSETHPAFAKLGLSPQDVNKVAHEGTLKNLNLNEDIKKVFVTARDVSPLEHVQIQAEFQKFSDSAVSKTINLAHSATVDDVKTAFLKAFELKCKGITVYRDGSRPNQVMQFGNESCPDCD